MVPRSSSGGAIGLLVGVLFVAGGASPLALDPAGEAPQQIHQGMSSFTISVVAVLLLSLLAVYRRRIRQLERREQELEALVARRTRELKEATLRDDLTGLRNRRFLQEIVHPETELFAERKQFLAQHDGTRAARSVDLFMGLFLVDIDFFKQINESYGHVAGDRVLQQFGAVLSQAMRKDDIAVRWGGEEFLIVLRHTAYEHIAEFATKLRRRIENAVFRVSEDPDDTVRRTCSVGYAPFPFHGDEPERLSFEQVVMLADLALYQAKQTGRNRTVGVMPTATPPSAGDVAPMAASLEYGEGNGLLEIRDERDRTGGDGTRYEPRLAGGPDSPL